MPKGGQISGTPDTVKGCVQQAWLESVVLISQRYCETAAKQPSRNTPGREETTSVYTFVHLGRETDTTAQRLTLVGG